jgi:hypothetical protein
MNNINKNNLPDELHAIREKLFMESKSRPIELRAADDNEKADEILRKWGIELEKADYLLRAVK